jgi:beta-lactamase class A
MGKFIKAASHDFFQGLGQVFKSKFSVGRAVALALVVILISAVSVVGRAYANQHKVDFEKLAHPVVGVKASLKAAPEPEPAPEPEVVEPEEPEVVEPAPVVEENFDVYDLNEAWANTINNSGRQVSAAAFNNKTGQLISYTNGGSFPTASVAKVTAAATLWLDKQSKGEAALNDDENNLETKMLTESDNQATTDILNRMGGVSSMNNTLNVMGMGSTATDWSWGLTTTTGADQVALLNKIFYGGGALDDNSRADIQNKMYNVVGSQRWGISAGTQAGDAVAIKNGWLPYGGYGWIVNSIGHVSGANSDYTIAIMTNGNVSMAAGQTLIQTLSKQAYSFMTK